MSVWVIEGITHDGRKFRPSDWVERLSSTLGGFGPDHRLRYGLVRPSFINGEKCLLVDKRLETENPAGFEFVCGFARTNNLRIYELDRDQAVA